MNGPQSFPLGRPVRSSGFSSFFFPGLWAGARRYGIALLGLMAQPVWADVTNAPPEAPYPDAGGSLIRVTGALALVLGLFLAGVWLFKNWQRLAVPRGRQPRLNLLESRSLGNRQAIFVVAYERQRFLVASSPAGVNLVSHLPDAEGEAPETPPAPGAPMAFGQALAQVLQRK